MRLLSRILLVFVIAAATTLGLYGQCATPTNGQGLFLSQNPAAKAALIATASPDIQERIDPVTKEAYYVRRLVNPWSEEVTYQLVYFNPASEQFEPTALQATVDPEQEGRQPQPCPKAVPQDSSRQERDSILPQHQPRRSSTIKIARRF